MKTWKIPVTWEVCAMLTVEADTLEEAIEIARDDEGTIPLPTDNDYVDGSWRLSETDEDFIRSCYNDEQEDDELNLPTEAVVEISELNCCFNDEEEIKDATVDFLNDEFGFCIRGCTISLEDEGLAKVTNIEWNTEE